MMTYHSIGADYVIQDLYTTSDFANLNGWTTNSYASNYVSTCGNSNQKLLGGYQISGSGVYFTKNFTNLPPHTQFRLDFGFFFGDYWNGESFFIIKEDSSTIYSNSHRASSYRTSFCGASAGDLYVEDTTTQAHTNNYLTLTFKTNIPFNLFNFFGQWFAITKIRINLCDATCSNCTGPSSNQCTSCYSGNYSQLNGSCVTGCNNNQFTMSGSNQCQSN